MKPAYECNSPEHVMSRRQMLGTVAAGSLGFGTLLQPTVAEQLQSRQKQVLLIWLDGAMSQLESWDPKPDSEFGGPFRAIPTSVPGIHVSELMPHTARQMHHLAVLRGMHTRDENHSTAVPLIQRGDPKNRGVAYPYLGAAVTRFLAPERSTLPPYIHIKPGNGGFQYGDGGFLGPRYGALALGDGRPPLDIQRPEGLTEEDDRLRNELRQRANSRFTQGRRGSEPSAYDYSYEMAHQLMRRRELFDLEREPAILRDRYGRHELGRHLLLARRLLEAGVTFVKVTSFHWDTHADNFHYHLDLVGQFERPFAALIEDLAVRGMLEHTLVIAMSEFGRTPKINERLGRDHWPEAWSLALAGCGLKHGIVHGRTNAKGSWVSDGQVDVGHLFHTIFAALGVRNPRYRIRGQPLPAANEDTSAIREVLA